MSANDKQVAGDHYRAIDKDMQHWDLAVHYQWDPFQYQITKYVMRWKDKHDTHARRLQDLEKAKHFLEKYIEVARKYDTRNDPVVQNTPVPDLCVDFHEDWQLEGFFGDNTNHYKCRHCGVAVRTLSVEEAYGIHDCAKPQGYVNQG